MRNHFQNTYTHMQIKTRNCLSSIPQGGRRMPLSRSGENQSYLITKRLNKMVKNARYNRLG